MDFFAGSKNWSKIEYKKQTMMTLKTKLICILIMSWHFYNDLMLASCASKDGHWCHLESLTSLNVHSFRLYVHSFVVKMIPCYYYFNKEWLHAQSVWQIRREEQFVSDEAADGVCCIVAATRQILVLQEVSRWNWWYHPSSTLEKLNRFMQRQKKVRGKKERNKARVVTELYHVFSMLVSSAA